MFFFKFVLKLRYATWSSCDLCMICEVCSITVLVVDRQKTSMKPSKLSMNGCH